jgi:hypothetical protein
VKNDLWEILLKIKSETPYLIKSLNDGKVDGSTYSGDWACLVGTIANSKGCEYNKIEGVLPDSFRPAERWFTAIKPGDTTENSEVVKITIEWIEEFMFHLNKK